MSILYSLPLPGCLESKMDRNWCHVLVAPNSRCLLTVMSLLGVQQALARLTGERAKVLLLLGDKR